jgi:hypothetical protein
MSALTVTPVIGAPAWTWVDANGTVHYSDMPVPGAKQIELPGAQGFGTRAPAATPPAAAPAAAANGRPAQQPAQPPVPYRSLTIASPQQQETLWNIGGTMNVQLSIDPALQPNHRVDVLLDGQRKNVNATSGQLAVPEVFRGVHTLEAVIIDQRGTEVQRSPATTFMVQQTSIQNPQRSGR